MHNGNPKPGQDAKASFEIILIVYILMFAAYYKYFLGPSITHVTIFSIRAAMVIF